MTSSIFISVSLVLYVSALLYPIIEITRLYVKTWVGQTYTGCFIIHVNYSKALLGLYNKLESSDYLSQIISLSTERTFSFLLLNCFYHKKTTLKRCLMLFCYIKGYFYLRFKAFVLIRVVVQLYFQITFYNVLNQIYS